MPAPCKEQEGYRKGIIGDLPFLRRRGAIQEIKGFREGKRSAGTHSSRKKLRERGRASVIGEKEGALSKGGELKKGKIRPERHGGKTGKGGRRHLADGGGKSSNETPQEKGSFFLRGVGGSLGETNRVYPPSRKGGDFPKRPRGGAFFSRE